MSDLRMELIQGQLNDIEENVRSIKATWGNTIMMLDNIKSSLKGDRQKAIDESYQNGLSRGYKDGYEEGRNDTNTLEYQRGLDDAWKAITKIAKMPDGERMTHFGEVWISNILNAYSLEQIFTILEKSESEPDKIVVGDEVKDRTDDCGVVTWIYGNDAYVLWQDGSTGNYAADELIKTGRHFNFLASLLNAMKEGAE